MRNKLLQLLLLLLALVGVVMLVVVFYPFNRPNYTITEPFVFPTLDELRTFETIEDRKNACRIPAETVAQMSTEALLETYLTYPYVSSMFSSDRFSAAFDRLKEQGLGLEELMERKDLCKVLRKRFTQITFQKDPPTPENQGPKRISDKATSETLLTQQCLELLCVQLNLDEGGKAERDLLTIIKQKNKERYERGSGYGKTSTYDWAISQDKSFQESLSRQEKQKS